MPRHPARARLLAAVLVAAVGTLPALPARARPAPAGAVQVAAVGVPAAPRPLPPVLFGVTADNVADLPALVTGARHLPRTPVTRLYFDAALPAAAYRAAVTHLHPVSYLMGELLDSSDERSVSADAYAKRVTSYLRTFGSAVDIWEIGNEVNGDWTGSYRVVAAKLTGAFDQVAARHLRSALMLYYNGGCGDGAAELDPRAFTRTYVPAAVRSGLSYVFLSYYPQQCGGRSPSAATWTAYFKRLHSLYPHALLGFGEVGLTGPATRSTMKLAKRLIDRYYGLPIRLPYYVGGYFWWYYAEDCLPYRSGRLWKTINAGFGAEAHALKRPRSVTLFAQAGLSLPTIWETPHYFASAADYAGIDSIYSARYEREVFASGQLRGQPPDYSKIFGQFFPYVVHDVYGEKIIPENLGNYEDTAQNNNPPRLPADLIANAQANLVVTQGVASFFFHPTYPLTDLQQIVTGIKGLGYTFVAPTSLPG